MGKIIRPKVAKDCYCQSQNMKQSCAHFDLDFKIYILVHTLVLILLGELLTEHFCNPVNMAQKNTHVNAGK